MTRSLLENEFEKGYFGVVMIYQISNYFKLFLLEMPSLQTLGLDTYI